MQKESVIKFFKRLLLFCVLVFVADRGVGYIMSNLYFSLKKGQFAQTTYSIDSASQDVIIFGSSRAIRHYDAGMMQDSLHASCYNVGRDAQFLTYYAALQDVILQKHKPKLMILDVNTWDLAPNNQKYERMSIFLPYVQRHPELIPYVALISPWEKLKLQCHTYLFNSTLFIALHDKLLANKLPPDNKGFLPLEHTMSDREFAIYKEKRIAYNIRRAAQHVPVDKRAIPYYKAFLKKAQDNNIKTYVVISPTITNEPETEEKQLLKTIADQYPNIIFIDYSHDPRYNDHNELFADEFHLNPTGARMFTLDLLSKIHL